MRKLFASKQIVTIFSIALCFAILLFAYIYRVNKAINAVSVPVAARDLKARELITNEGENDSFETVKVAQSLLTNNVITNKNYLVGGKEDSAKYVNYNTFIPKGSMFYDSAVTTWDHMPDSAWADIEEGHTLLSLSVNSTTTYGNSIFPGDKIDLFYKNTDNGKFFIGPLTLGIKVLAVKDSNGNHIFKKSVEQREAVALIFSVPDNEFLFMKAAFYVPGGEIIPIPRNADYNPEKETNIIDKDNSFIKTFLDSRMKLSPGISTTTNTNTNATTNNATKK